MAAPADSGRTVVRVIGSTPVDDTATADMVADLRSALDETVPSAAVGGPAAQNHDLTEVLTGKAPVAIGIILIVAFMLLLVVFRSLVIALFSVVMNLSPWVLRSASPRSCSSTASAPADRDRAPGIRERLGAPVLLRPAVRSLDGLPAFLLAAIRERYEATGDTQTAIREGITRTGRPITNAALIMIVVFVAFGVTGPIPPTELGITLALAVALDATVVRTMLVPATMSLLGDRNWYIPRAGWTASCPG